MRDAKHEHNAFIEIIHIPPEKNRGLFVIDVPTRVNGDHIGKYFDPRVHRWMINGGYFNEDFSPTGYCRINGRDVHPHRSPTLSGYIALDEHGRLSLLTKKDDVSSYPTVLQNGPFVIDPGGKIGIRSRVGKAASRTVLGRTDEDSIIVAVTAPIDLYDLAHEARRVFPEIERMLNLDGGPSTALKTRAFEIRNSAPVRNYLAQSADGHTAPDK
jgi:hypothetical protein